MKGKVKPSRSDSLVARIDFRYKLSGSACTWIRKRSDVEILANRPGR